MKSIITYFIKYPVATNVFILAFIIFGLLGARSMRSSFFPLSDSLIINISLSYPGASPQEMEEGVVLKIEDNLKGIVGIDRVTSVSRENSAVVTVETEEGRDIDVILQEVKNAVDRVPSFPSGMEPPVVAKRETIRQTIEFNISGENVPLSSLKQYARQIENDLRNMEGISQIEISGFPDEEIEVAVRENDLRAYDLNFSDVAQAVQSANILVTGGNIKTATEDYLIRVRNKKYYGNELNNIVVKADANGKIIRLMDVAEVRDSWSENPDRLYFNSNKAINIVVSNTKSEALLSTAEAVKGYIDKFNQENKSVQLNISSDSSITLNQRTQLLAKNALMGVGLVLLMLALFLNFRLAFWVALGIPISFFGMFIFVDSLDVTINVLSLFAMIIVIGILVDDGIVIGENIYHHFEKGKNSVRAAIDGTMEVFPPIVSAILTTIIAFSTFFFLDGRMGTFFSEVSTVVSLTLAVSLIEALLILPAHIAHSGAMEHKERKKNFVNNFFESIHQGADKFMVFMRDKLYASSLKFFLKYKFLGVAIPVALLIISFGAVGGGIVRAEFFPSIASDRISVTLAMPQGTNEAITDSIISGIEQKVWEVNEEYSALQTGGLQVVENVIKRIGPGSSNATLTINLLPGESRDFSSADINKALREKVGKVYGVESLAFGSGGRIGGSPVAVALLGNNINELKAATEDLKAELELNPILKDITDNDPAGIKEVRIQLKDNAYLLGLNYQSVMNQVRSGFFGFQAQRFQRGEDEIKIWVRYDRKDRSSIKNLDDMHLVTPSGARVPLSEVATYEIARGDLVINHLNGKREIRINADLASLDDSATEVMDDIKANVIPSILAKYPTITPSYEGQNREAQKTMISARKVGVIILLLIFFTIAFTFRSFDQPIILLFMIPFSLIGVIWGHYLHGFKINVLSWLGIIALIGILVNDGLVLIGKFNTYLKDGQKFDEALYNAGMSRFRAIFLTTITTVVGMAPLLLEKSRQAQFLKPMAVSISYGLIVSTLLTLVMLPILLAFSNFIRRRFKWLITGKLVPKEDVERAILEQKSEYDATH